MGQPAVVMNDNITGQCLNHQVPGPVGSPMPGPPFPFSAPITLGCEPSVLIGGKPAAVQGASGFNVPPHVGLHPADPHMAAPLQEGKIVMGSKSVLVGGKPAAFNGCESMICFGVPGQPIGSAADVLVGP